jgi:hypothetical protein
MSMQPSDLPNESQAAVPQSSASSELNQLSARVNALETRLSPNSWLYSNNFFKRALALWGHVFLIQLIIAVVIWAIVFGCVLLFGGLGAIMSRGM